MLSLKTVLLSSLILSAFCMGCDRGGGSELQVTPTPTPAPSPTPAPFSRPLEKPCDVKGPQLSQVYSECGPDGFWHVVQDDYYECPTKDKFRVFDKPTLERCKAGGGEVKPPPSPKVGFADVLDSTCQSPKFLGGSITFSACENGVYVNFTYKLYECVDGRRGIIEPPDEINRTNIKCDSGPPSLRLP